MRSSNKVFNIRLFFLFLILVLIILVGCGGECKTADDCLAKTCNDVICEKKTCVYSVERNCCGNGIEESLEDGKQGNECTCPDDYGACEGSVGDYMEKSCDENDQCIIDVKAGLQKPQSFPEIKQTSKFKLTQKFTLDEPYNLKRSVVKYEAELLDIDSSIENLKINKVTITANVNNADQEIASKDINKVLLTVQNKVEDTIPILYEFQDAETSSKLKTIVEFEYYDKIKDEIIRDSFRGNIGSKITFVEPDTEYGCDDEDCDDDNECTIDTCIEGTAICDHNAKNNCCGNYICEDSETKTSCPADCGECKGSIGDYLEYVDVDGDCVVVMKENIQRSKVLAYNKEMTYFTLSTKLSLQNPFDISNDQFDFSLTLDDYDENDILLPFNITRVQILDSDILIAEKTEQLSINSIGQEQKFTLDNVYDMIDVQEELSPKLKVYYTYTRNSSLGEQVVRDNFERAYSENIVLLNPER